MSSTATTRRADPVVADQETKPGPKTTEFWIAIFTNLIGVAQITGAWEYLPDGQNRWVLIALAIVNALYAVGRGVAKSGQPYLADRRVR